MWDILSSVAGSLWGAAALGFTLLSGAVVWQLVKIARGAQRAEEEPAAVRHEDHESISSSTAEN